MKISVKALPGLRVTVMGLGLQGGGLASALYFARRGARVTVTDLRDEKTLKPSLVQLKGAGIRTVLGKHDEKDFIETDLIIKNPAVPKDSPFLNLSRLKGVPVETDLSIFLHLSSNPVLAVTGSKGKSTTAAAIYQCLKISFPGARLGGNITVSPLIFLHELKDKDPVVLELSSWQLADLQGKDLLKPAVSLVTNILPDHQDKYPDMKTYLADKKVIFQSQGKADFTVLNYNDPLQRSLARETRARVRYFADSPLPGGMEGAFLQAGAGLIRQMGETYNIFEQDLEITGIHNRLNLLSAGLAASLFGLSPELIAGAFKTFSGLEHRLEYCHQKKGIRFYNDSAATIPQATIAALKSFTSPPILITGGTDKNIDFSPLPEAVRKARSLILLQGSATLKMQRLFDREGIPYQGPFNSLEEAVREAYGRAEPGTPVLFSPGCSSFEMFLNEFDRGKKFKQIVAAL